MIEKALPFIKEINALGGGMNICEKIPIRLTKKSCAIILRNIALVTPSSQQPLLGIAIAAPCHSCSARLQSSLPAGGGLAHCRGGPVQATRNGP